MITVVVVIIIIIIMPADNHDDDFEGSGVHYTCTEKYRKHFRENTGSLPCSEFQGSGNQTINVM